MKKALLILLYIWHFSSAVLWGREYPFSTNAYTVEGKLFGSIRYAEEDLNNDGLKEKIYDLRSLFDFLDAPKGASGPKDSDRIYIYGFKESYLVIEVFGNQIFLICVDSKKKFQSIFENQKEIRDWTKAYTGIKDDEAWIVKYNLGYVFKELKIKDNKIHLLTGDGGSGATGGYNIEHVFEIKDGKPVTLVSRFVPNPEKDKRARESEK